MKRYICIHGHFYQPPRENPWLEEIEQQDNAFPYHDWNQRISAQCYAPNAAARVIDSEKRIIDIVNNYANISFNFGPTVLSWMAKNEKDTYLSIIEADKKSQKIFSGHGSAIAQCYSHMIMPLANLRDKKTQIIWGIKDFEARFKRKPLSIWLPETAVDDESLELMVENGLKFVILSPFQAKEIKVPNQNEWTNVEGGKINSQRAYLYRLPSGKTIALFFYDGKISQDMAFSDLMKNGNNLANRLIGSFSPDIQEEKLVNIAVDGETFGHHKEFGDMALAYCLRRIQKDRSADNTLYSVFLETHKPTYEVRIWQNSAWSCAHGVGRWSRDCGCCIDSKPGWNQEWRKHLRAAMDWLRDELARLYEEKMSPYSKDPWFLRDSYIELILDRSPKNLEKFFKKDALTNLKEKEKSLVLKLLEMQRHAMLMYTSCGWFFDDVSGIETVQIISYAARAIQLAKEISGISLEKKYTSLLEKAKSNLEQFKNGAFIYETIVKPQILDLTKIAIDYIVSSLFEKKSDKSRVYAYSIDTKSHEIFELDAQNKKQNKNNKLSLGKATISSNITLDQKSIYFAALLHSDHSITLGLTEELDKTAFSKIAKQLKEAFQAKDVPQTQKLIKKQFTSHDFSFWDLFQEDQRHILKKLLWSAVSEIETTLGKVHDLHYSMLKDMKDRKLAIPQVLIKSLDLILNAELIETLSAEIESFDLTKLKQIVERIKDWSFDIDLKNTTFLATKKIESLVELLSKDFQNLELLKKLDKTFEILSVFALSWNLWKPQNIYFIMSKSAPVQEFLKTNKKWAETFKKIGNNYLKVKI